MAQYGGLTRLQYVFWDEVADFGMPNPALQWLGGIQLKSGCAWKALDSTRFGHSFSNDYADGIYTRTVEFGAAQEETSLEIGLQASKSRHFVVRGTGQDGQQWLIASPNAPMTLTMNVVRTVGTVTIWKGVLKSETKEPLFRWSDANGMVRVRYSETPAVSNPVTVGSVPTPLPPQGSTVTTISAISTGSGRYTTGGVGNAVHVRTDGRTAEAQAQAAETARLQAIAQANALLEAQRIAQAQADAALMTAQQATLERQAAMAAAETARLQAIAAAEAARLQAEADARIAAEAAQRQVLTDLVRLNNATVQALQTATAQALAQAQAAVLAAQPKPYSGSAAAGAFLLTEPVVTQPVTPEPVPYVPYTTQTEDTG